MIDLIVREFATFFETDFCESRAALDRGPQLFLRTAPGTWDMVDTHTERGFDPSAPGYRGIALDGFRFIVKENGPSAAAVVEFITGDSLTDSMYPRIAAIVETPDGESGATCWQVSSGVLTPAVVPDDFKSGFNGLFRNAPALNCYLYMRMPDGSMLNVMNGHMSEESLRDMQGLKKSAIKKLISTMEQWKGPLPNRKQLLKDYLKNSIITRRPIPGVSLT